MAVKERDSTWKMSLIWALLTNTTRSIEYCTWLMNRMFCKKKTQLAPHSVSCFWYQRRCETRLLVYAIILLLRDITDTTSSVQHESINNHPGMHWHRMSENICHIALYVIQIQKSNKKCKMWNKAFPCRITHGESPLKFFRTSTYD